jgi:predicted ester cyclase
MALIEGLTENSDLLAVYRDYLACLNNREWDDLGRFVVDEVVYNGERLTTAS